MKETEMEKTLQADPELDAALAGMAEEVPPMPADFHEKWMNAVRAEARKEIPPAEEKPAGKPISLARWTRIFSTAAVFVFLIGGTLLYRQSRNRLSVPMNAKERETAAAVSMVETAEEDSVEYAAEMMGAEAAEPAANTAVKAAEAVPALSAGARKEASSGNKGSTEANTAGFSMEEPVLAAGYAAEESADTDMMYEAESFAAEEEMAEPEPVPVQTVMPTAMPTEAPAEEGEVPENPAEENGFFREAGTFLKDMGDFLLAALPYLAVLAVPVAAALIVRRRKKGTK